MNLLRCDRYNLFTWSKTGIIIFYNLVRMNLDELELYDALDLLENILEQELTNHQRIDVLEVREHFKERLRT
jgi:hypothetical protein